MSNYPRLDEAGLTRLVNQIVAHLPSSSGGKSTFYGTCTTAADAQAKVGTVDSSFSLEKGVVVGLLFTNTNTYSATSSAPVTLNVNGTGAKEIRAGNISAVTTGTNITAFGRASSLNYYMYNGSQWVWMSSSYDNDTTYTNKSLGQGYGTCGTAAATAAKVATMDKYQLVTGGIVSVYFSYAVPANATLNINGKGAKPIYNKNAAITANIIKAGNMATFMYDGTYYRLISVDAASTAYVSGTTVYI